MISLIEQIKPRTIHQYIKSLIQIRSMDQTTKSKNPNSNQDLASTGMPQKASIGI